MILINSYDFGSFLNSEIVNVQQLHEFLGVILNDLNLYNQLLGRSGVRGISVIAMTKPNSQEINLCAVDMKSESQLFNSDLEQTVTRAIKSSIEIFNTEYEKIVEKQILGEKINLDNDFKRTFNCFVKSKSDNTINVGNEPVGVVSIDKTILNNPVVLSEPPLTGRGLVEIFEFQKQCLSITPDPVDGKRYPKIEVVCDETISVELLRSSYRNARLYGRYKIEKRAEPNGNYYLIDWVLEQPDLL